MRFWEVDFARGTAVILMVLFNWSFALKYLNILSITDSWIFWEIFPRFIASMFIFIVGVSLVLSYNYTANFHLSYKKNIKRGLKIFGLGLLITLVTWLFIPQDFIFFGILHLIGFSVIFATPFLKFKKINLYLSLITIIAGVLLSRFSFNFSWLSWLGFIPKVFSTLDYFPVLPWFGFVLLGIYFGNTLYKHNKRKFKIQDYSNARFVKFVNFLGKNSLTIYLLHQPLLILILFILGYNTI
ncbi:MAG: heparan-alpha-glucosaminide N-acetyltransferase [Candidatus Aenigmarchaeota archaeon]|nr:heparan-alpha-glucosaminide N-acetyltransferase [Candidatus Aenigmarchaeota archaeon]